MAVHGNARYVVYSPNGSEEYHVVGADEYVIARCATFVDAIAVADALNKMPNYRDALADLEEYALLMKTRIDQVDAPPVGGKE